MLTSRVVDPPPPNPEQEDVFSAAIGALFTDDTQNSHGTPGHNVTYRSPRFGDIYLSIPLHPDAEDGRKLFAHYLWNAAVIAADAIESASCYGSDQTTEKPEELIDWDPQYWDMKGKRMLELGAGTALPSLIACLCEAFKATITDHPSSPALTAGAIDSNVRKNLFREETSEEGYPETSKWKTSTDVTVHGFVWGTDQFLSPINYGRASYFQPKLNSFNRIMIADCLWMPSQHTNLVKTILDYLDPDDNGACALVIAGFHTGRSTVANFFGIATGGGQASTTSSGNDRQDEKADEANDNEEDQKLLAVKGKLRASDIFEMDVDGNKRPWATVRAGEDKLQAKRWCVCAVLVRR